MSLDVIIAWSGITLSICAQPRNQSQKRGFVAIVKPYKNVVEFVIKVISSCALIYVSMILLLH